MLTATLRTNLKIIIGILIATIHATVAIVVYRAIAHIELVHHIHHTHDDLRIMSSITINLYVEDMSTTCHFMIRSLNFCLMTSGALVVYRYVVGIGIIIAICDTRNNAKLLTILLRELTTQALCGCGKHGVVVMILLTEVVDALTHI